MAHRGPEIFDAGFDKWGKLTPRQFTGIRQSLWARRYHRTPSPYWFSEAVISLNCHRTRLFCFVSRRFYGILLRENLRDVERQKDRCAGSRQARRDTDKR